MELVSSMYVERDALRQPFKCGDIVEVQGEHPFPCEVA